MTSLNIIKLLKIPRLSVSKSVTIRTCGITWNSSDGSKNNQGGLVSSTRSFSSTSSNQSSGRIDVNVENGIRKIVINRPEAKNALSYEMFVNLGDALFESNTDNATRVISITGAGDFFSSGNDLRNWHTGNQTINEIKEKTRNSVLKKLMYGFIDCQKPIIALVNGPAIGAGATMLPFCDQVLSSDKAFFFTPFPSIGIVPEFCSSYLFPKIMGYAKANDMLLFQHKMFAKEALECGFVTKVFPSDTFAETCEKLVEDYTKLPLEPLLKAKELIRAPERERLRQLCAYEMDFVIDAIDSPYVRINIDKFFSKKGK